MLHLFLKYKLNTRKRKYTGFKFPHFNYLFVLYFVLFYFFIFSFHSHFLPFQKINGFCSIFAICYENPKTENDYESFYTEKMQTIFCCREEIKTFMQISRPSYWNIRTSQSFAVQRNNSTRIRKIITCGTKGLWIRQVFSLVFS